MVHDEFLKRAKLLVKAGFKTVSKRRELSISLGKTELEASAKEGEKVGEKRKRAVAFAHMHGCYAKNKRKRTERTGDDVSDDDAEDDGDESKTLDENAIALMALDNHMITTVEHAQQMEQLHQLEAHL